MEVTLKPDNRKATIIAGISDDLVKVRLEDGREFPWPISKINMPPKEGEDTLKMVVIPAINRLEELQNEYQIIFNGVPVELFPEDLKAYNNTKQAAQELIGELKEQSLTEFKQKWGLI